LLPATPMPISRLASTALALLLPLIGDVAPAMARSPAAPETPPDIVKLGPMGEIVFYLARGDANACGPACNEWIAADGKIDLGAAQRLRRILAKLGHRKLPIFFHSPGGVATGSIELGRLIREQKLETSVAHTIPRGCDRDKQADKSCDALKRSGQELEAEFDPGMTLCNSACVYALAGGAPHLVPPGVRLGIHDIGLDPDRAAPRGAALVEVKRTVHERIQGYLRDMGIDKSLFPALLDIPYERARFIDRDDIVRFGLDRREFGETMWQFADRPKAWVYKKFFARTGSGEQILYRTARVSLRCGVTKGFILDLVQPYDSSKRPSMEEQSPRVDINGQQIYLPLEMRFGQFETISTPLSSDAFDSVRDDAMLELSGFGQVRSDGSAAGLKLNMGGFSSALVRLRKSCDEDGRLGPTASARGTESLAVPANLDSKGAPPATLGVPEAPAPIELTRYAVVAQGQRFDFVAAKGTCSKPAPMVRIVEQPQHGMVALENGQERSASLGCTRPGAVVFYEPSSGYAGPDLMTLSVIESQGNPIYVALFDRGEVTTRLAGPRPPQPYAASQMVLILLNGRLRRSL
jgi:hypothetical protein